MENVSLKILCVDDEENVLHTLKRLLIDEPYEVLTACSGAEGLAVLEAHSPVQIVLSDYRMPAMNGVEFLSAVRERWPGTVRIVLSGYADTAAVVSAINEGQIYRFIAKPWNDEELRMTIAKSFEHYSLQMQNALLSEELKETNDELRSLRIERRPCCATLDSLPLAVVTLDQGGTIDYWNERAKRLFAALGSAGSTVLRSEVFSGELNAFIDGVMKKEEGSGIFFANGRSITLHAGVRLCPPDGWKITLVFDEKAA